MDHVGLFARSTFEKLVDYSSGVFFVQMRPSKGLMEFELISTSYEGGTLRISFFLRTSKGLSLELISAGHRFLRHTVLSVISSTKAPHNYLFIFYVRRRGCGNYLIIVSTNYELRGGIDN